MGSRGCVKWLDLAGNLVCEISGVVFYVIAFESCSEQCSEYFRDSFVSASGCDAHLTLSVER